MFRFTLTLNLNLYSGSCSMVWLNRTLNIMFGSGSNIVCEVRNRTAASLYLLVSRSTLQSLSMPKFPTFVSAILCVGLREFEKPFARNKECGFHGENKFQNGLVYTYKLSPGLSLQDFSIP